MTLKTPSVSSTRMSLPLGVAGFEPDNAAVGTLGYATDTDRVRVKTSIGWADVGGGGGGTVTEVDGTNGITSTNPTGPIVSLSPTYGSSANTVCEGNDSRLSNSRAPTGAASGDLAGSYPSPEVAAIHETSGPTKLTVGSISSGQLLVRSGSTLVGQTGAAPTGSASGDLAGSYPSPEVAAIHETSGPTKLTIGSISTGQLLVRSGSTLVGQTGAAPTGSASGDLAGSYPSPEVAAVHETSGPTKLTIGAIATGQALVRSGSSVIGQSLAALYSNRDPIWDPPTTPSADDEEFTTDVLASGGVWTLALVATPGTPMTRDGNMDLSQSPATGHYRSSCIGSTLYIQIRKGDHPYLWKGLAGALSTDQFWYAGVGFPMEPGILSAFSPLCGLFFFKDNAGAPSNTNQAFVRTGSSSDRIDCVGVIAGVSNTTSTNQMLTGAIDGLMLRINHGSSASANVGGYGWRRSGTMFTSLTANAPQFNSSSDKVGFDFLANSNSNGPVAGVNSYVFAVHFLRRVAVNSGYWLAQP